MIKPITKDQLETVDVPTVTLCGASLGFLFDGFLLSTIGALIDAPKGSIWNWSTMIDGLINLSISVIFACLAIVYWRNVPRKSGAVFPKLIGFSLLTGLMSLISGLLVGLEFLYSPSN